MRAARRAWSVAWCCLALCAASCTHDEPSTGEPTTTPSPGTNAQALAVCEDLRSVVDLVTRNGSRTRTFELLHDALRDATSASSTDPRWLSLRSGVAALQRGLEANDEGSAELGIAIVRDQCRHVAVYLPGAVHPSPETSAAR